LAAREGRAPYGHALKWYWKMSRAFSVWEEFMVRVRVMVAVRVVGAFSVRTQFTVPSEPVRRANT
jgi:hypothetical protein